MKLTTMIKYLTIRRLIEIHMPQERLPAEPMFRGTSIGAPPVKW